MCAPLPASSSSCSQSECSYDLLSRSFKVVSSHPLARGQQVLINYGSQSNDQLLQLYGFVEGDNVHDR